MQKTAALVCFLLCSTALAHSYDYQLDQGRRAPVSIETSTTTSDWLVLMPGSACHFYEVSDSRFISWLKSARSYNVLIIGKAGSDLGKDEKACREDEFQRSSVRSQRIKDNLTILRDLVPAGARILLAAISEGAYIAPDVANADSRVKAYLDLSGNTQSWMTEELMCVPPGPQREKLEKFFDTEVRGHDSFTKYYSDWTYGYLNSYDTHQSYDMMKALTIPVAWLNGDHDEILWVEGARLDAMDLIHNEQKANIEYHWLAGADHGLRCAESAKGCDEAALDEKVKTIITDFAARHF